MISKYFEENFRVDSKPSIPELVSFVKDLLDLERSRKSEENTSFSSASSLSSSSPLLLENQTPGILLSSVESLFTEISSDTPMIEVHVHSSN